MDMRAITLASLSLVPVAVAGTVNQYGGAYANWPSVWTALPSLNDPVDGIAVELDLVGDSANPGGYWANNSKYFFLRARVAAPTVTTSTYKDTVWFFIDVPSVGKANVPDYALAWDSLHHKKLEFQVPDPRSSSPWKSFKMDDRDGNSGQVKAPDINSGWTGHTNTTGDGYVRTVDGQAVSGGSLGTLTTSFIDVAVSWEYLGATYNSTLVSTLAINQDWRIAFGTSNNANDHSGIGTDVSGGATPNSDMSLGWSSSSNGPGITPVPLPGAGLLALPALAAFALVRRRRA